MSKLTDLIDAYGENRTGLVVYKMTLRHESDNDTYNNLVREIENKKQVLITYLKTNWLEDVKNETD